MVDVLVSLGDGEATLQLEEETTEVTRLLTASNEGWAVYISIFLVELDQLDLSMGGRCCLA